MSQLERRTFPVEDAEVEVRQSEDGEDEFVLKGHAAVFNSRSKPLGPPGHKFVEEIEPGAFSSALEDSDIRALFNHDPSELLARESAGTLEVEEDDQGLRYAAELGDDSRSEFVKKKVSRGEVTGNSFSFAVSEENESWNHDPADSDLPVRTIHEFDRVDDVGPVSYPAYEEATISQRVEKRAQELNADQQQDADPLTVKLDLDLDTDLMPEPDPNFAERDKEWVEFLRSHLSEESRDLEGVREASEIDFEGTETEEEQVWGGVELTFDAFVDGFFKHNPDAERPDEDIDSVDEAPQSVLNWAAARSIKGDPQGDTFDDVVSFPVVNPNTNQLNEGGVDAADSRAGQQGADDVQRVANNLKEEHFGDEDEDNSRDLRRKRLGLIG